MTKLTVAFRHFAVAPTIDRLVQLRCDGQRHTGTEEQAGTDRKVAGDRVQLQGEERVGATVCSYRVRRGWERPCAVTG